MGWHLRDSLLIIHPPPLSFLIIKNSHLSLGLGIAQYHLDSFRKNRGGMRVSFGMESTSNHWNGNAYHLASSTGTNCPGNCCWMNATGTTGCCCCSIAASMLRWEEGEIHVSVNTPGSIHHKPPLPPRPPLPFCSFNPSFPSHSSLPEP